MNALAEIAVHPVAQALTWALVHFIWQGAALGLLAFAILRFAPLSAQGRYVAGIVTLMAMLVAPIATTAWLLDGGGIVAPATRVHCRRRAACGSRRRDVGRGDPVDR